MFDKLKQVRISKRARRGAVLGLCLCAAAGLPYAPFAGAFVTRTGEEAARHLMEVAGGLRSQIWGEDQILTQVKGAAAAAREAGSHVFVDGKLLYENGEYLTLDYEKVCAEAQRCAERLSRA